MSRLILASASPRRAELLRVAGLEFEPHPVSIDESPHPGEDGITLVIRLAHDKAAACLQGHPGAVVLAADTVVLCRGEPRGKPRDREDYVSMMREFSGAPHEVVSGVCVMSEDHEKVFHCVTTVVFGDLSPAWIEAYWASGEPKDKAGGYAIQGRAGSQVREVRGSYTNVVGLPLDETCSVLSEFGILQNLEETPPQ